MLKANLNKIILCVTGKNLVAGIWHAEHLQEHHVFEHQEAFGEWLTHYPNIPIYLIANAVEEDYRLENLPHSVGREKRELIQRKLNQFYRGLVFRTAHFIEREKDKRKDDKFLFVALNNDDFLQSWVEVIQLLDGQLVGVYLLPMLSQRLIEKPTEKSDTPHTLLCERLSSGVRQSYLYNGQLRMSRLIQDVPTEQSQLGYFYLMETQKTRLYLMSKRFISREVTLNLQLADLTEDMQAILQSFRQEPGIECTIRNLQDTTRNFNLSPKQVHATPELLHMQLLANGHLVDNLAPDTLTKNFWLSKVAHRIKLGTAALSIVGAIITSYFVLSGLEEKTRFEQTKNALEVIQQRKKNVDASSATQTLKAQDLRTAMHIYQKIQQLPTSPQRAAVAVSRALEKFPDVKLKKLKWLQTQDSQFQDIETSAPANLPNQPLVELVFVSAEIVPFDGNYRTASEKVNQLTQQLKQDAEVSNVEILQLPVNQSSQHDLRGTTTHHQTNIFTPALFKIKLQLKPMETR